MLWVNTMKIYTCILFFITQVVFTQATCISKTAKEFDNNCYELFTTHLTLIQAQKYCSNFNGTRILAKVSSPSVLKFLNSLRPINEFVWLGANDTLHNGEWVWADGTKANLTSMWNDGEPNNERGIEHCLQIYNNGKLNDMPCNGISTTSFICMEIHEDTITTSKSDTATPLTSLTTTEAIIFTTVRNDTKPSNVSDYTLETTTTSKTDPTTSVTSTVTTAAISFTTEGNVSEPGNILGDTLEKMNSLGLPEGIGIGTGIGVVITLLLLAVVLAIMFCCKTKTVNGNRKESGKGTDNENQTRKEVEDVKQVELNLYADVLDLQEQSIAYDNMTQTKTGCVQLVEPKETKHLYAGFLDKQDRCYVNS